MIRLGNFFFHYRNGLFPVVYALLLVPSPSVLPDFWLAAGLGFAVALAVQLLRFVTIGLEYIIRGGRGRQVYAEKLVQGGLFAHCRNPLYVGNYLIILGVGIASNSILFLALALPFFTFAYAAIIAAEENFLRNKFGQEFDEYCARVNRLLPNFSGLRKTVAGMRFNWRRVITAEYGSTYIWLIAVTLVALKNIWQAGEYRADNPAVRLLWADAVLVTLGYFMARILKKGKFLGEHLKSGSYSS